MRIASRRYGLYLRRKSSLLSGKLVKHKKSTIVFLSIFLIAISAAVAFYVIRPMSAVIDETIHQIRHLDTSGLNVASYLTASAGDISAFDAKVAAAPGTAGSPVLISNRSELLGFAYRVNNGNDYAGKHFALTANIDLQGGKVNHSVVNIDSANDDYVVSGNLANVWIPIGNEANKFRGNFDGRNFTISNMTSVAQKLDGNTGATVSFSTQSDRIDFINTNNNEGIDAYLFANPGYGVPKSEVYAGLFGYIENGTIENVVMAGPIAIARQYASFNAVATYASSATEEWFYGFAQAGAVVGKTTGVVKNSTVRDAVVLSGSKNGFAGGVAGSINNPSSVTLENLSVSGTIVAAGTSNHTTGTSSQIKTLSGQAGGLVGGLGKTNAPGYALNVLNSSFVGGEIMSNQMVGGIAAAIYADGAGSSVVIDNVSITTDGILSGTQGGGLFGSIYVSGNVTFNTGASSKVSVKGNVFGRGNGYIDEKMYISGSTTYRSDEQQGQSLGGIVGSLNIRNGNLSIKDVAVEGDLDSGGYRGTLGGFAGQIWNDGLSSLSVNKYSYSGPTVSGVTAKAKITNSCGSAAGLTSSFHDQGYGGSSSVTFRDVVIKADIDSNSCDSNVASSGLINTFYTQMDLASVVVDNYSIEGNVSANGGSASGIFQSFNSFYGNTVAAFDKVKIRGAITGGGGAASGIAQSFATNDLTQLSVTNFDMNASVVANGGSASGMFQHLYNSGSSNMAATFDKLDFKGTITGNGGAAGSITQSWSTNNLVSLTVSNVDIQSNIMSWGNSVGGFFEYFHNSGGNTVVSFNNIDISGTIGGGGGSVSGITPSWSNGSQQSFSVTNFTYNGDIISNGGIAAGLIGYMYTGGDIILRNITQEGDLSGTSHAVGLIGSISTSGYNSTSITLEDWKSTGSITGGCGAGGAFRYVYMNGDLVVNRISRDGNVDGSGGCATGGLIADALMARSITINADTNDKSTIKGNITGGGVAGLIRTADPYDTGFPGAVISIKNLTIDGDVKNVSGGNGVGGLFYDVANWAVISMDNVKVLGDVYGAQTGGLIGDAYGQHNNAVLAISNVTIDGDVTGRNAQAGGLFASATNFGVMTISNSKVINSKTGKSKVTSTGQVGGIAAIMYNPGYSSPVLALSNIEVTADILGGSNSYAGGLVGRCYTNDASMYVSGVKVTGDISSPMGNTGGLFGMCEVRNATVISGVDVKGDMTGADFVGGFAGRLLSYDSIVVQNSTYTGDIDASSNFSYGMSGGFAGEIITSTFTMDNFTQDGSTELTIASTDDWGGSMAAGFAGKIDASSFVSIKNSKFNGDVSAKTNGLCVIAGGMAAEIYTYRLEIENVKRDRGNIKAISASTSDNSCGAQAGGLVGQVSDYNTSLSVLNSHVIGNIEAKGNSYESAGGIFGSANVDGAIMDDVSHKGTIKGGRAAGIVGYLTSSNNSISVNKVSHIGDLTSDVTFSSGGSTTGGFAGGVSVSYGSFTMTNSKFSGDSKLKHRPASDSSAYAHAGGVVGSIMTYNGATFDGIEYEGDIQVDVKSNGENGGHGNAGTLAGHFASYGPVVIRNWDSVGKVDITVDGYIGAGGLMGEIGASGDITLENINHEGSVAAIGLQSPATWNSNNINAGSISGNFAAYNDGSVRIKDATFTGDISVDNKNAIDNWANSAAGGLAGHLYGSYDVILDNVEHSGDVTVIGDRSYSGQVGGIAGALSALRDLEIKNSRFSSSVSIENKSVAYDWSGFSAGGLAGVLYGSNIVLIDGVDHTGDVSLKSNQGCSNTGGIAGNLASSNSLKIMNSKFKGSVISDVKDPCYIWGVKAAGLAGEAHGNNIFELDNVSYEGEKVENITGPVGGAFVRMAASGKAITINKVSINAGDVKGYGTSGGFAATVGINGLVEMYDTKVFANVVSTSEDKDDAVGGVFGGMGVGDVVVRNLNQKGNVTGWQSVGGFVGGIGGHGLQDEIVSHPLVQENVTGKFEITNATFRGDILQKNTTVTYDDYRCEFGCAGEAGGVIGGIGAAYKPVLTTVIHEGKVTGTNVGGLVGATRNITINQGAQIGHIKGAGHATGGLVGVAVKADISESMTMGDITNENEEFGAAYAGGLIGGNMSSIFETYYGNVTMDNDVDYKISNSWFGGHVNIKSPTFAFAGGLVGAATDHVEFSNLGNIRIDNSYVVGNAKAQKSTDGKLYHGSVIGYAINEPTIDDTYVDYQELDEGRCAVSNHGSCVGTPELGDNSYFAGVTNLKTMQMTGDGKGLKGAIKDRMWYRDEGYNLLEDRAVDNMVFVATNPNSVWRVPSERLVGKVSSMPSASNQRPFNFFESILNLGVSNAYAATASELYEIDTHYPRLAWIDTGLYARPTIEMPVNMNPGVPRTGFGGIVAIGGIFGAIMALIITAVSANRRKKSISKVG